MKYDRIGLPQRMRQPIFDFNIKSKMLEIALRRRGIMSQMRPAAGGELRRRNSFLWIIKGMLYEHKRSMEQENR